VYHDVRLSQILTECYAVQECDLGQQSVLHAVQSRPSPGKSRLEAPSEGARPLNETLIDLQLNDQERRSLKTDEGYYYFFFEVIFCSSFVRSDYTCQENTDYCLLFMTSMLWHCVTQSEWFM